MIEKLRLVPSKRRHLLGWIASNLLIGMGIVMVHNGQMFGWFNIILFGPCFFSWLLLLPGASWLQLDKDGFTVCVSFRPDRYSWNHIQEMAVWQGVVSFKLQPEHRGNRRGQAVARAISGYDGSIPDMFRMDPKSLLELMVDFKRDNTMDSKPETPVLKS